jgi:hypothetical protein
MLKVVVGGVEQVYRESTLLRVWIVKKSSLGGSRSVYYDKRERTCYDGRERTA